MAIVPFRVAAFWVCYPEPHVPHKPRHPHPRRKRHSVLLCLEKYAVPFSSPNKPDEAKKWGAERTKCQQGKTETPEKK
jgi:hypothetical protein